MCYYEVMDLNKVKNRRNDWKAWFNDYGEAAATKLFKDRYQSYPTPQEDALVGLPPTPSQHLYVVTDGEYIKIGITRNTRRRVADLQVANARQLRIVLVVPYGGRKYEVLLHNLLKKHRRLGEWFKITKEVEQTLEELAVINYETYGQVFSQCATVKTLAPSH